MCYYDHEEEVFIKYFIHIIYSKSYLVERQATAILQLLFM
jgi:hypothetical protein